MIVTATANDAATEPPPRDLRDRLTWLAVGVGLALRVWEYSSLRQLYMDEEALLTNLVGVPVLDFSHVLSQDQLAPPGFLVVERIILRAPMNALAAGRLFPLLCGLASMLLIVPLARRYVDRLGVPIAAWVLALADHLIYYSSEIKQYSCDLVLAMAALLAALPRDGDEPTPRRARALAILGVVMVAALLTVLTLGVLQLGIALLVRNTALDAAAEGARFGALADNTPADGVVRTRELITTAIGGDYAHDVHVAVGRWQGHPAVTVTVRTTLPVLGLLGVGGGLEVAGHAARETLG